MKIFTKRNFFKFQKFYSNLQHSQELFNKGNYQEAKELLQESDDPETLTLLGKIYLKNQLKDYSKAHEYFKKASEMGSIEATTHMGILYENGFFVTKDIPKAIQFYQTSIESNDKDAMLHMAKIFLAQENVEVAKELLIDSSNLGNLESTLLLGDVYKNESDIPQALKLFSEAGSKGSAEAFNHIGEIYEKEEGYQSIKKAYENYKKAASMGSSEAYTNLSNIFLYGKEANYEKIIFYLKKGVELGNVNATRNLALMYFHGTGVKKNLKKANELLLMAIKENDANSMNIYALSQQNSNISLAIFYYKMAVEHGSGYDS